MPVFETGAIPFGDGGICFSVFFLSIQQKKGPPDIRQPFPEPTFCERKGFDYVAETVSAQDIRKARQEDQRCELWL